MKGAATYSTGKPCPHGHPGIRYALGGKCVACCSAKAKAYYTNNIVRAMAVRKVYAKNNPEKRNAWQQVYKLRNPGKEAERSRKYRAENIASIREDNKQRWRIKKGMPIPHRPMPAACENCQQPQQGQLLHLDHCHETGVFRGWLCFGCNTGLGKLGDNVAGIQQAMNYLKRAYGEADV